MNRRKLFQTIAALVAAPAVLSGKPREENGIGKDAFHFYTAKYHRKGELYFTKTVGFQCRPNELRPMLELEPGAYWDLKDHGPVSGVDDGAEEVSDHG